MGSSDPVSTAVSIASLASGCGWLEDVMLEPVPVEEAGGYAASFADFPILWKSPMWNLQSPNSLPFSRVKVI